MMFTMMHMLQIDYIDPMMRDKFTIWRYTRYELEALLVARRCGRRMRYGGPSCVLRGRREENAQFLF